MAFPFVSYVFDWLDFKNFVSQFSIHRRLMSVFKYCKNAVQISNMDIGEPISNSNSNDSEQKKLVKSYHYNIEFF